MKNNDLVDLLSKKADIIYKKTIILLAAAGGSGSYAIATNGTAQIGLFVLFSFFTIGIIINYFDLNTTKKRLDDLEVNYG